MTIETIIDRMVLADTADSVWEASSQYFEERGFDRVIYADLSGQVPVVRNSFPESFGAYYADVCNPADDPFFRYCCATLQSVGTGIEYADDYAYLTASERQIIETAREAGMRAGFSCTLKVSTQGSVAGWNIGSSLMRAEVEAIRAAQGHGLRLTALYAHERMTSLGSDEKREDLPALSPREHDCLAYLAKGLKNQQIADRLGIRPVTVELHLRNARERLGARTREQALAKALLAGLLRL